MSKYQDEHRGQLKAAKEPGFLWEFDYYKHVAEVQLIIQKRVMQKIFQQTVKKNLLEKKLIASEEEYNEKEAVFKSERTTKRQIDKLETWLRSNIFEKTCIKEYETHTNRQKRIRQAKLESVMALADRISDKLRDRRLETEKDNFIAQRSKKNLEIPKNHGYQVALSKLPKVEQKIEQMDHKLNTEYEMLMAELNQEL